MDFGARSRSGGAKGLWESQGIQACSSICLNSQCFITSLSLGLVFFSGGTAEFCRILHATVL